MKSQWVSTLLKSLRSHRVILLTVKYSTGFINEDDSPGTKLTVKYSTGFTNEDGSPGTKWEFKKLEEGAST
jgi:hypothetical protein